MLKFLADVNIEKPLVDELRSLGYDTRWVAEDNPGLEDVGILSIAQKEDRVLLTNDKDFGEIVFRQRATPSGIILFRIKGQSSYAKIILLKKLLMLYGDKIARHFTVVTKNKFRFIPLQPMTGEI